MEALSFSLAFIKVVDVLLQTKKKALEISERSICGQYPLSKQISIIVDVDDKNCFVQLTVALKLNLGVRQWPSR